LDLGGKKWRKLEQATILTIMLFSKLSTYFSLFFIPSNLYMGYCLLFPTIFLVFPLVFGLSSEFIYPNFTASEFQLIDRNGVFLSSRNGSFAAAIFKPHPQQTNFYLCVIHMASNTTIWSANRDTPISNSGILNLTTKGITISDQDGNLRWSTPPLLSSVNALLLTEMGNLVLLDHSNSSLWESFHHPTDTIVIGQRLPVGTYLSSAVSEYDLSSGDHNFTISTSDALLQWYGQTYWKLSMDTKAYINSNYEVKYMTINRTGLYLLGHNASLVVIQVILSPADFRIAKLDPSGKFNVRSYSDTNWVQEFSGPDDNCKIPSFCHRMGLCTDNTPSNTPTCSCPPGFHVGSQNISGCVPGDGSYSLPFACNSANNGSRLNSSVVAYLGLGSGIDYFANDFSESLKYVVNLSVCQDLCSGDCSCLGIFYGNSSGSCYVIKNELGSVISSNSGGRDWLGYIKVSGSHTANPTDSSNQNQRHPTVYLVLLPFTSFFLLVAVGYLLWRRWALYKTKEINLGCCNSHSSEELDAFYIPGLPKRFDYEELEVATDSFSNQIGSGGFGAVYKGMLPDKTVVAIKKIANLGIQGRKEFYTEIAVIGNIHHVNVVRLKGFCAQGRQRLLVYEYMNLGSLDRTLFGSGAVLEWQERFDIALGAARGLAYLHSGCEHKIIHCDVKPENILLDDHLQAKISDFGLSKLLSPEQSGLFTTMRGTRGYLAPEWLTTSTISEKTDVYSFGMVLLELVSGRKNCSVRSQSHSMDDSSSGGGHSSSSSGSELVYYPLFALEMHEQGKYLELADPRLEGRVTMEEVEKLVRVALCCLHEEPALRPNMVSVVGMLEGGMPLDQPRTESLNFLRFYGRRFIEASTIMDPNGSLSYPQANSLQTGFSFLSSQQISGPR
jgi:serine/threonine protein kinase